MTTLPSDKRESQILALSEAVRTLTAGLSLDRVLRQLAEIAAKLVNARYAAFGVPDGKGGLSQFLTYGMTDAEIEKMEHHPRGLGLLGLLMVRPEPVRVPHIHSDERAFGFPPHHPYMTSFLGVPIYAKDKLLGSLYLCDRLDGQPFTNEDEKMILLLAGHGAVAIENAKLAEQLSRLAVVEERDRISMDLHDGIIQSIYAIGMKLELMRTMLPESAEVDQQIGAMNHDLNQVIEDLRRYIQNLQQGVDHSLSLRQQINEIAENFQEVCQARLLVDLPRGFAQLDEQHVHALVQVAREALSNIVRHAGATQVYLDIHETQTQIALVISDDGIGFDPVSVHSGNGLRNIQQRAHRFGGKVEISSRAGRGTTLTVRLPIKR